MWKSRGASANATAHLVKANPKNLPLALALAALALSLSAIQRAEAAAWTNNTPLLAARYAHTATLLPNGKVLVVGGHGPSTNYLASGELYDPGTATWTATGASAAPRGFHTATLLPDGKVLVAGGFNTPTGPLSSAELYDPATGTWTTTGPLTTARESHTATLLSNGKVLVVGGDNGLTAGGASLASAELYDPATGKWTSAGTLRFSRSQHTATFLPNGRVLIAGGINVGPHPPSALATAELYDPAAATWTNTGTMTAERSGHTATLLPNGSVLAAGGRVAPQPDGSWSADLYDPDTGLWTAAGTLSTNASGLTATLMPNGKLLVTGGGYARLRAFSTTQLYDPATDLWTDAGSLAAARQFHTATLLPNGRVLVVGGSVGFNALSSTELYENAQGVWTDVTVKPFLGIAASATLLPNGKVLVVAGPASMFPTNSARLYDPASGTWAVAGPLYQARNYYTATLLPNGKVLVGGGRDSNYLTSAELYDPELGFWTITGSLNIAREFHTATLLRNGKVLVAGGAGGADTSELYDPLTETWHITGPLHVARYDHTVTLLLDGRVLVTGGYQVGSAELYDPATGSWTTTGEMSTLRAGHTATLLPNGQVLVAGGGSLGSLASAELYDLARGLWQMTGSMNQDREGHSATLLSNGKVLVAGGLHVPMNGIIYDLPSAELYDPGNGQWTLTAPLLLPSHRLFGVLLANQKVLVVGSRGSPVSAVSAQLYGAAPNADPSWQPQIATTTSPLSLGSSLTLTGSGFRGVSEGSCGNSQDSATDYPLLQMRSLESGQTIFLLSANWQTNSFTSVPVWGFPPGFALATVFVNGIPSTGTVVNISVPAPTPNTLTDARTLTNGAFQFAFTNAVGALFGVLATTNLALPLSNWTALGGVTELSPGQFQFTDPQATAAACRFYRIRSP